jgi:hypothetical protein
MEQASGKNGGDKESIQIFYVKTSWDISIWNTKEEMEGY